MVVDFDVDTGHKPVFCVPAGALSQREQAQCSVLAMPDSNTGLMGDTVYTFRMRRDRLPLFATSLAAHEYLFGTSFFRQVHDPSQPRSFSQRAVVAVSQRPYPGLCSQVVRVTGPPFLDSAGTNWAHACAVLESSWDQSCRWPRPVPGVSFDHPLLGRLLQFRCPFTATDDGTAPGAADSRVLGRRGRGSCRGAATHVCALGLVAAGWTSREALEAARRSAVHAVAGAAAAAAITASAACPGSGSAIPRRMALPEDGEARIVLVAAHSDEETSAGGSFRRGYGGRGGSFSAADAAAHIVRSTGDFGVPVTLSPSADAAADGTSTCEGSEKRDAATRAAAVAGLRGSDGMDVEEDDEEDEDGDDRGTSNGVTLNDAFAARWQELPGVFQEVGLFSTFRALVPCLWTLWELALLGRPVLVFGPSPKLCGDAVMGIVSLVAPLPYHGDYRPYFTLYDPDFGPIQAAFEEPGRRAALAPPPSPVIREAIEAEAAEASAERERVSAAHASKRTDSDSGTVAGLGSPAPLPDTAADAAASEDHLAGPAGIVRVGEAALTAPSRVLGRGQRHPFPLPLPAPSASSPHSPTMSTAASGVAPLPACPWQTPLVLGSTNPIFVRALEGFPVTVWIGAHPDALPNMPKAPPRPVQQAPATPEPAAAISSSPEAEAAPVADSPVPDEEGGIEPTVSTPSLSVPQLMVRLDSDGSPPPAAPEAAAPETAALDAKATAAAAGAGSGLTQHGEDVWKRATGTGLTPERTAKLAARLKKLREARLRHLASHPAVTPTIVPASTPLHTLLPRPGEEPESAARLIIKRGAASGVASSSDMAGVEREWGGLVPPDSAVLNQLLKIRPEDEMGPQLRLNGAGTGARGGASINAEDDSADGGDVPGVVINNALLRQHFRRLTHAFLRPFERFFTIGPVDAPAEPPARARSCPPLQSPIGNAAATATLISSAARLLDELEAADAKSSGNGARGSGSNGFTIPRQPTFGPYDNLGTALLPVFSKEAFLASLATKQPPKLLRRVPRWLELYKRFVESPHFRPWFTSRREEARASVAGLSRRLRLAVTAEQLVAPLRAAGDPSPGNAGSAASGASTGKQHTVSLPPRDPAPVEALRLYSTILACVQREREQLSRDLAHSVAVAEHLAAVEEVLRERKFLECLGLA